LLQHLCRFESCLRFKEIVMEANKDEQTWQNLPAWNEEQSNEEIIEQRLDNDYSIPNFLSPSKLADNITTEWIEHRIIEGVAKYNTKFVIIDHLGYIDDFGEDGKYKRENTAYRVGKVMRELKNIAKRWDVIIYLSVHISQHDESQPPTRKDIKNSSDIIQECDTALFLWRNNEGKGKKKVYKNETMVSIQKNRRKGKNGTFGLCFNTDNGSYYESNWIDEYYDELAQQEEEDSDDSEMRGYRR